VLARKSGALRNGAPFKDWLLPASLERLRRKLQGSDDGDRQMVKVLSAVRPSKAGERGRSAGRAAGRIPIFSALIEESVAKMEASVGWKTMELSLSFRVRARIKGLLKPQSDMYTI
jgi:hypothetical protein